MENSYGIGVANRYDLFYNIEEVDPVDYINEVEEKRRDKVSEKENQKVKKTKQNKDQKEKKSAKTEDTTKIVEDKVEKPIENNRNTNKNEPRVKFSDREERNNRRNKQDPGDRETTQSQRFDNNERGSGKSFDNEPRRFDGDGGSRGRFSDEGSRGRPRGSRGGRGTVRSEGGGGGGEGESGGSFRGSRGNFRGGRGRGDFRGKREFDRQSGNPTTGVKHMDKRDGSGSFNWGSDKDEIGLSEEQWQQDKQGNTSDLDTSGENTEKQPTTEDGAPASGEEGDASPKEIEPKEMTLDEWKAHQKREKPQFNIRRPGEGENDSQWRKTYVLKKKDYSSSEGSGDEEESEEETQEAHHGRKKTVLSLDFQFSDAPTRGRGRGRGRGGDRGGGMSERRGRGGVRGRGGQSRYQSRQEAPKMDDEKDFPSLG